MGSEMCIRDRNFSLLAGLALVSLCLFMIKSMLGLMEEGVCDEVPPRESGGKPLPPAPSHSGGQEIVPPVWEYYTILYRRGTGEWRKGQH